MSKLEKNEKLFWYFKNDIDKATHPQMGGNSELNHQLFKLTDELQHKLLELLEEDSQDEELVEGLKKKLLEEIANREDKER